MESIENLKILTKENILSQRSLVLKAPSRYREIMDYNIKYFRKTIPGLEKPVSEFIETKEGKIEEVKFVAAPIPDKNILLAMAFSKAEKLYSEMKKKLFGENIELKGQKIFSDSELADADAGESAALNPIECLAMSSNLLQGKNSSLVKSLKKGEMEQLNQFAYIIPVIYKALNELRNYHSHILHEPGPIKFLDLYGEIIPDTKITQEEWDNAGKWFAGKMEEVKSHRLKTLKKTLEKTDLHGQKRNDIEKIVKIINGYCFEKEGYVTKEALLFIACMFLRKSDAEYFVKKWTGLKKTDDSFRITQTFFTYYSIRDKKSLHTQNSSLLKFRKIIGILSTMPEFNNDCFVPFNTFIKKHNDRFGEKIEQAHTKTEKEKWKNYCIPLRKNFNPTHWYLNYLVGKEGLGDFKIACYKSPNDRLNYLKENGISNGVAALKLSMKRATGKEKIRLTSIYKENKKNFLFKEPSQSNENYCIKNENAIIQYSFPDFRNNNILVTVQANLSSDLLMKWAFADIILDKEKLVKDKITKFMIDQYMGLNYLELNRKGILLPPSISKAVDNPQLKYSVNKAQSLIQSKLNELQKFHRLNSSQRAPWRYQAKKKMDMIFNFVHLTYTFKALDSNKSIDVRRHESLSDTEYLDAMEFIRFYGKNYATSEFKKFFLEDKKEYFRSIEGCLAKSQTLEELYNEVFGLFCRFYENIFKKLNKPDPNLKKFIDLFKPPVNSDKAKVKFHAKLFATNQVVLHELINIQELAKDKQEYKEWTKTIKDPTRTTDFSLIRYWLSNRNRFDTNIDFMMKIIMPELLKRNLLPKNERGTLQGNESMFNTLMKNKTDELVVWEVAKYFREKAYNSIQNKKIKADLEKTFQSEYQQTILVKDENKLADTPYKTNLFFSRVNNQDLILPLTDKEHENSIEIKIKPKKFDDEFQYYETGELYNFVNSIKNDNQPKVKKKPDGYWHFEDLNKAMKDEMAKYLDDLYLLLKVEKEIVLQNFQILTSAIGDKYSANWDGYYLPFGRQNPKTEPFDENILAKIVFEKIRTSQNEFELEDLINYRNKILHQQIQPDQRKYISIKRALFNFCSMNNMLM